MTNDPQRDDTTGLDGDRPPGIGRRSALAVAWTVPVIAGATAAPAASASTPPKEDGTFLGVWLASLGGESPRAFRVEVYLNGTGTPGTPVVLPQDAVVRVDSPDHDVAVWPDGIVPEGPRAGMITIPAGVYPTVESYTVRTRSVVVTAPYPGPQTVCELVADPRGRFAVEAKVTRGPTYRGPDPYATGIHGRPSAVAVLTF
ncbi:MULTISPECIES: hypothetical protein [unclassified Rathayibacter]|uniref:hypothetical protein n=1 Tax=unclassified Rathayibacter TaxID=2609250 RepID=UPI0010DC12FB|nr:MULTISPECIES: hypothetical protein [unclassified Rathayibacter]TCL83869.1 hypothetical protein EDF49_103301 [Rathayibacter sp. PhB192]TCM29462.1 hypothetical protein EDF43_103301 [Rathayibacter sp. PhB179]